MSAITDTRCAAAAAAAATARVNRMSFASIHTAVPPVLDRIVTSIPQPPSDFSPSFAQISHQPFDEFSLLRRDRFVVQTGFQVLVISFSALFGRSMLHVLRNSYPVVWSLSFHKSQERGILLG